jgi:hypothetical protein
MRELYLMALYATRPLEGQDGGDDHEVALRVALAVMGGEEEARARGRERLLEVCPPDEGWTNHHVTASAVGREQLRAVFEALSEDASPEGGAEAAGLTELIM